MMHTKQNGSKLTRCALNQKIARGNRSARKAPICGPTHFRLLVSGLAGWRAVLHSEVGRQGSFRVPITWEEQGVGLAPGRFVRDCEGFVKGVLARYMAGLNQGPPPDRLCVVYLFVLALKLLFLTFPFGPHKSLNCGLSILPGPDMAC